MNTVKPTEKEGYKAVQARLKCKCTRPFREKGQCRKCHKRLRDE